MGVNIEKGDKDRISSIESLLLVRVRLFFHTRDFFVVRKERKLTFVTGIEVGNIDFVKNEWM